MASITIKNVPEDVHAVWHRRAALSDQSLQVFLRNKLIDEARRPTLDEVLDRAGGRAGGILPMASAVKILRDERAGRR